jgi:hypothetical protein
VDCSGDWPWLPSVVEPSPTGRPLPRETARRCRMEGGAAQAARARPAVWARRRAGERKAVRRGGDGGREAEESREATALADARGIGIVCWRPSSFWRRDSTVSFPPYTMQMSNIAGDSLTWRSLRCLRVKIWLC